MLTMKSNKNMKYVFQKNVPYYFKKVFLIKTFPELNPFLM